ncbi:unnamed protein product, partial [Effrenium voratum]
WVHPSKLHGYVPPGPGAYAPEAERALQGPSGPTGVLKANWDGAASPSSPSAAFSLPGPGNP